MRVAPSAPALSFVHSQGITVPAPKTGATTFPKMISPERAIGVSEASVAELITNLRMAEASISSVAIAMDVSIIKTFLAKRLAIQVNSTWTSRHTATFDASPTNTPSLRSLITAIMAESVEDGVQHPAETLLSAFTQAHGVVGVLEAIAEAAARRLKADFLKLLARSAPLDTSTRSAVIANALKSSDLEIRDAAVQAAETWHDPALAQILRAHKEPVPWLADYATRVAADIEV